MAFKMWIIFSVLIVINFQSITCKCLYETYDFDYPPVFTQQFDRTEFVVKSDRRPIVISEGSYVKAYCDSNFSMPIFENREEPISSVLVKCLKGVVHYKNDDHDTEVRDGQKLACHGSHPTFRRGTQLYCSQNTPMDFGLQVDQNQIVLSSFCYDVKNMETTMIHYHIGDHSQILQPSRGYNDSTDMPINFIDSNTVRTDEINSFFNNNSSHVSSMPQYKFDYLVPAERLVKGFTYQTEVLEGPSSIPWWTNLKEGNWKIFEDILEKKILSKECDIYTGIVHYDQIPLAKDREREMREREAQEREREERERELEEDRERERQRMQEPRYSQNRINTRVQPYKTAESPVPNSITYDRRSSYMYPKGYRKKRTLLDNLNIQQNDLTYMSSNVVKSIPFYVWTYIKSQNSTEESVVVIAINSPFVTADSYRGLEFCPDMCRNIPWLKEFETAKMPALGYVFCCRPNDASKVITDIKNYI